MYWRAGPSIQLGPAAAAVSSSVQIASMKEEKELSPRGGPGEGICFLAPKMRWEESKKGRKRKRNGQAERQIQISIREGCTVAIIFQISRISKVVRITKSRMDVIDQHNIFSTAEE